MSIISFRSTPLLPPADRPTPGATAAPAESGITLEATIDLLSTDAFQKTLQDLQRLGPVQVRILPQTPAPAEPPAAQSTPPSPAIQTGAPAQTAKSSRASTPHSSVGTTRMTWRRAGAAAMLALGLTSSIAGLVAATQQGASIEHDKTELATPATPAPKAPEAPPAPPSANALSAPKSAEPILSPAATPAPVEQPATRAAAPPPASSPVPQVTPRRPSAPPPVISTITPPPAHAATAPVAAPHVALPNVALVPPPPVVMHAPAPAPAVAEEAATPAPAPESAPAPAVAEDAATPAPAPEPAPAPAVAEQAATPAPASEVAEQAATPAPASEVAEQAADPQLKGVVITDPFWAARHPVSAAVNAHVRAHGMGAKYLVPEESAVVVPPAALDAPTQQALGELATTFETARLTPADSSLHSASLQPSFQVSPTLAFSGTKASEAAETASLLPSPTEVTVDVAKAFDGSVSVPLVKTASPSLAEQLLWSPNDLVATRAFAAAPEAPSPAQAGPGLEQKAQLAMKVGTTFTLAGTAFHTLTALEAAHSATALAASARATAALAQASAQSGNLAQAMQLGAQAKAQGAEAMSLASTAKASAHTAGMLSMVSGGIAIADGAIDIHQGVVTKNKVVELHHVADDTLEQLDVLDGADDGQVSPEVQADYTAVKDHLGKLTRQASRQQVAGGAKAVFGGLMIASPATGPAAPVVGAIGAVGYLGVSLIQAIFH